MKLDITFTEWDLRKVPRIARQAEALGLDGIWIAEATQDPLPALTLIAEHTSRIEFGTGIMLAFPRSPMTTAYSAWTLQRYSEGRFILGLGAQVKAHIERRFSAPYDPPGPRMRDVVLSLRAIFDSWQTGKRLSHQGKFYNFSLMTPFFSPGPMDHHRIPVVIAGVNPYMCNLAGELCDGLYLHPFNTVRYIKEAILPRVEAGLQRSGRSRRDVSLILPAFVVTGANAGEQAASRKAVCEQIAFYASTLAYKPVLDLHGWSETGDRLRRLAATGKWHEMGNEISDDILDAFAITAPLDQVAEKIGERYEGLVDRISFYHLPCPLEDEAFWHNTRKVLKRG